MWTKKSVYVRKESKSDRISLRQFHYPRTAHLRPPWLVCAPEQNRRYAGYHRICLEHQHGRCLIVLEHQYGRSDVMWKRSIVQTKTNIRESQTNRLQVYMVDTTLLRGSEWGGPLVGCRIKFSNFVGSRLKFSIFVGSRLNFSIFVGCRKISVNK